MWTTFVLIAIFGLSMARPQGPQNPQQAYITRYDFDNTGFGGFSFNVETSDGFNHQQVGELVNPGAQNEAIAVRGSYSYIGNDGVTYTVGYTADENGFQPEGAHLPPSAGVVKKLGIPSAALASLAGGGLG